MKFADEGAGVAIFFSLAPLWEHRRLWHFMVFKCQGWVGCGWGVLVARCRAEWVCGHGFCGLVLIFVYHRGILVLLAKLASFLGVSCGGYLL